MISVVTIYGRIKKVIAPSWNCGLTIGSELKLVEVQMIDHKLQDVAWSNTSFLIVVAYCHEISTSYYRRLFV